MDSRFDIDTENQTCKVKVQDKLIGRFILIKKMNCILTNLKQLKYEKILLLYPDFGRNVTCNNRICLVIHYSWQPYCIGVTLIVLLLLLRSDIYSICGMFYDEI